MRGQGQIPGLVQLWDTSPRQNTEAGREWRGGSSTVWCFKGEVGYPWTRRRSDEGVSTESWEAAGAGAVWLEMWWWGRGRGQTWEVSSRRTGARVIGADKMQKGERDISRMMLRFLGGQYCHLRGQRGANRRILGLPSRTC